MKFATIPFRPRCGARAGILLAGVCLFLGLGLAGALAHNLSDVTLAEIRALMQEKENRTPAQLKLESALVYSIKHHRNETIAPGVNHLEIRVVPDAQGRVPVVIRGNITPALETAVRAVGTVHSSLPQFKSLRATVPLASLETIAGREEVKDIYYAYPPKRRTGSVNSEADATLAANTARLSFGVNGAGVKVGVISDSVDFLAGAQATGDLPAKVTVLPGQSGVPGSSEGTAMLELIHDLAPGAELFFATCGNSEAEMAANVLALRAAGCHIVLDDIGWAAEAPFQDNDIGIAIDQIVAEGAVYLSSAGNANSKAMGTSGTWEGDFKSDGTITVGTRTGEIHAFETTNTFNRLLDFGGWMTFLNWSDPLGASTNDYDLFLVNAAGNVLDSGTTAQNGTTDGKELCRPGMPGERLAIVKFKGDPRFLHLDSNARLEFSTDGQAMGHPIASGCISVAAVDVAQTYPNPFTGQVQVEDFSSDGPRRVFFHPDGTPITPGDFLATGGAVRQFPIVASADGTATATPGFNPFFGTSAAAPHAAAIAALLWSYNPSLTSTQIWNAMITSCLDIMGPGVDVNAGHGLTMADLALANLPPPAAASRLLVVSTSVYGGNNNGIIDYNECNNLDVVLTNVGSATATGLRVTLSTTTPGAAIGNRTILYPNMPVGAGATNPIPFQISTSPDFVCGQPIDLTMVIKSDQSVVTNLLTLPTGVAGTVFRFDNGTRINIPDGDPNGTNSTIVVANVPYTVSKVVVSLHVAHPLVSDLSLELVAPDGTRATLAANIGGAGQNFGLTCSPESFRTTFDDGAPISIVAGGPPYVGSYKPQQPLGAFSGKFGTNLNGIWKLHVVDQFGEDAGAIQCWSLMLTPSTCVDGGGQCPGSDLATSISALPNPGMVGSPLTYTVSVVNHGPSIATNIAVSHVLPASVQLISFTPGQGGASHAGGVVSWNTGRLLPREVATMSVMVNPLSVGLISSSATASSEQPDGDLANNTSTALVRINPLSADLRVNLLASPAATFLGNPVTYSLAVTNSGPGIATGVVVTNTLPAGMSISSATVGQGSATVVSNLVICVFGPVKSGETATATIVAYPTTEGTLLATARVAANTFDPIPGNNTAVASVTIGPAADLALALRDTPDPVVVGKKLTYSINVTNLGPSVATGIIVSGTLPPGLTVNSNRTSQGSITISGNNVTISFGTLTVGGAANADIHVTPGASNSYALTLTASAAQGDINLANNTASVTTLAAAPFIQVVGAGAELTAESVLPPNGAVDLGETVTAILRLRNAGNVPTTNLTATLVSGNGVVPGANPTQTYGVLQSGGFPVGKPFSFTASGSNGVAVAVLELQDGSTPRGTVSFTFTLPRVQSFANTNAITLRDNASAQPYPSIIQVAGVTGTVGRVTASLVGVTHGYPEDVDVLLASPVAGAQTMLMSGAGSSVVPGATLTFDPAATNPIPNVLAPILGGTYLPAAYVSGLVLPSPAPAPPQGGNYTADLGVFNGKNPNGAWSLFANDHAPGDAGQIAQGWRLELTLISPVNQVADLSIAAVGSPATGVATLGLTNVFVVSNAGPNTASFVTFSNLLPASVSVISATASQGSVGVSDGVVLGNLGSLSPGASATVTLVLDPALSLVGTITNTASVYSVETDLVAGNNTAALVSIVNAPLADLAVGQTASPASVLVGQGVEFHILVTNLGPQVARSVVLSNPIPAEMTVSATASVGTVSNLPGAVVVALGDLDAYTSAQITLVATSSVARVYNNQAIVSSGSSDTAPANNTAIATAEYRNPAPVIVADGAQLLSESGPVNGSIDPGETVTVALNLKNTGSAPTASLVGTLQNSGGVTPSGGSQQTYGVLIPGGASAKRPFTFVASGPAGSTIMATLVLQDAAAPAGEVTYTFTMPGTGLFTSTAAIQIPDQGLAAPYPSTIEVANLNGSITKVTATLNGLTHRFPRDLSVLLVSPSGASTLLLSRAGGGNPITNAAITFDDAGTKMTANEQISTGSWQPARFGAPVSFPAPAPAGGYGTTMADVASSNPNGTWLLYVLDDTAGDGGVIENGWSLTITTAETINPLSDLAVSLNTAAPAPLFTGQTVTNVLSASNLGPADAQNVVVLHHLPDGMTFGTLPPGVVAGTNGTLIWTVGALPVNGSAQVTVLTIPTQQGLQSTHAAVSSASTDLNAVNNSAMATFEVFAPLPARLKGTLLPNKQFQVDVTAQSGLRYQVQASGDFTGWTSVGEGVAVDGKLTVIDTNAPGFNARYYRAVLVQ